MGLGDLLGFLQWERPRWRDLGRPLILLLIGSIRHQKKEICKGATMQRTVQQHFVTRAYLEKFAPTIDAPLFVYKRGNDTYFRSRASKVARMRNYYSPMNPDGTYDDRIESQLEAHIETPGLQVLSRFWSGHYDISRDARLRLSALLAVQEYRVPWMREQMEGLTTEVLRTFTTAMLSMPGYLEKEFAKQGDENAAESVARFKVGFEDGSIFIKATEAASLNAMGIMLESFVSIYYQMKWKILESSSIPFVTSDCPVHRYYLPEYREKLATGLHDYRVQVRFPLSPSQMLVISHDFGRIKRMMDLQKRGLHRKVQKLGMQSSPIHRVAVSEDDVRLINRHTMSMAKDFVFAASEIPDALEVLSHESMNVSHTYVHHPGGGLGFIAHYPQFEQNA